MGWPSPRLQTQCSGVNRVQGAHSEQAILGGSAEGEGSPTIYLHPPLTKREKSREQNNGTLM